MGGGRDGKDLRGYEVEINQRLLERSCFVRFFRRSLVICGVGVGLNGFVWKK